MFPPFLSYLVLVALRFVPMAFDRPRGIKGRVDHALHRVVNVRHERDAGQADHRRKPPHDLGLRHGLEGALNQMNNLVYQECWQRHRRDRLEGRSMYGGTKDNELRAAAQVLLGRVVPHVDRHVQPCDAVARAHHPLGHHGPHGLAHVRSVGNEPTLDEHGLDRTTRVHGVAHRTLFKTVLLVLDVTRHPRELVGKHVEVGRCCGRWSGWRCWLSRGSLACAQVSHMLAVTSIAAGVSAHNTVREEHAAASCNRSSCLQRTCC
mmetsp:Transcript_19045/g.40355  ORF Transcript_19045/g.40355 Transcript_19045/m.40355 type:complete len:263 (-) Transcript_19045:301-1089(-)